MSATRPWSIGSKASRSRADADSGCICARLKSVLRRSYSSASRNTPRNRSATAAREPPAERLRGVFRDALEYERRKTDFGRAQMQALSASARDLDALLPVLHGRVALIAYANRRSDIETALRLAKEVKLKLILAGAAEGWE